MTEIIIDEIDSSLSIPPGNAFFTNTRVQYSEKHQDNVLAIHIESLYRSLELAHRRITELEKKLNNSEIPSS